MKVDDRVRIVTLLVHGEPASSLAEAFKKPAHDSLVLFS